MVGFWVQRIGADRMSPETQMLQPMHSRISSIRPSSIFFGRKPADADHRFGRQCLDPGDEGFLYRLRRKARGLRIIRPVAEHHVPEIRQFGHQADDLRRLVLVDAVGAEQFVDGDTDRDGATVANCLLGVLD
jgi:hypothetical protein